jgi:hypothetical protein
MIRRPVLTIGLVLFASLGGQRVTAQDGPFDLNKTRTVLSRLIEKTLKDAGVPSISIALVRGDSIVWKAAFGYANVRTRTRATPETMYNAASTFKAVTAIGPAAQLCELSCVLPDGTPRTTITGRVPVISEVAMSNRQTRDRVTPILLRVGIAIPFLYFGLQLIAAPFYPGYSFVRNVASELGSDLARYPTPFNIGIMILGILFVREHYPAVHRYLLYLTGQRDLAEDLTQETFLQAWCGLADFEGRASLQAWLHRITRREFLDSRIPQDICRSIQPHAEISSLMRLTSPQVPWAMDMAIRRRKRESVWLTNR